MRTAPVAFPSWPLGFLPVEIEAGHVVFDGTPDQSVYNPIGTVHKAWSVP